MLARIAMKVAKPDFAPGGNNNEFKICRRADLFLVCRCNHAGGENYGVEICSGQYLCLVCRGSFFSSVFADGRLGGTPCKRLIKQGVPGPATHSV